MMKTGKDQEKNWRLLDDVFKVSLYLKSLNAILEIIGGLLLLFITPDTINHWARALTEGELSEDPNDFIANHILKSAHHLSGSSLTYGAIYLLSHGIVKLFVIIQVLREKLWAYKALIIVLGIFVIYQTYQMIVKFNVGILLLTIFDLIIIYLTFKEDKKHHEKLAKS
jgi:uncharacterized membrane protein